MKNEGKVQRGLLLLLFIGVFVAMLAGVSAQALSGFHSGISVQSIPPIPVAYSVGGDTYTIADYVGTDAEVVIPSELNGYRITEIGRKGLSSRTHLTTVTIPDSVINIAEGAFSGCDNLTIYGSAWSYAKTYADQNGIPFVVTGGLDLGDVNGDDEIDAADALKALQHSVQLITLEGDAFSAADVKADGKVDASDALLILQYSVDLIQSFPAESEV